MRAAVYHGPQQEQTIELIEQVYHRFIVNCGLRLGTSLDYDLVYRLRPICERKKWPQLLPDHQRLSCQPAWVVKQEELRTVLLNTLGFNWPHFWAKALERPFFGTGLEYDPALGAAREQVDDLIIAFLGGFHRDVVPHKR